MGCNVSQYFFNVFLTNHYFIPQQFSRNNNSVQANSLKDLLQSKIDDLEKQVLSRVNSIEDGKPGLRNETEQRGRVESTLTSLHQRITDLEKGASSKTRQILGRHSLTNQYCRLKNKNELFWKTFQIQLKWCLLLMNRFMSIYEINW